MDEVSNGSCKSRSHLSKSFSSFLKLFFILKNKVNKENIKIMCGFDFFCFKKHTKKKKEKHQILKTRMFFLHFIMVS